MQKKNSKKTFDNGNVLWYNALVKAEIPFLTALAIAHYGYSIRTSRRLFGVYFGVWYFCLPHFFCREDTTIKELQTNGQIRDREIRLIGSDGQQLGIVSSYEGQRIADESGLDLVKISPNSNPPVCRIMDYSKYKYEQNKKEKEMRRNQKTIEVKEVWLSMTIDIGDLNTKANIARKFLNDGNKVKATIRMRGRQQAYAQQGVEVMKKFAEILSDVSKIDKQPTTEGRNISMFLVPLN